MTTRRVFLAVMRPLGRGRIVLFAVLLSAVIFLGWIGFAFNSLVAGQTNAEAQWAQVENVYQRKIDLIPQLLNAALNYTTFERTTYESITRLRSQWINTTGLQAKVNITNALDIQINAVYENYPELRSIEAISSLMYELAGSENRITVERMRFNDQVRAYNIRVRSFPSNIIAGSFGFRELGYYDPIPGGP